MGLSCGPNNTQPWDWASPLRVLGEEERYYAHITEGKVTQPVCDREEWNQPRALPTGAHSPLEPPALEGIRELLWALGH